MKPRRSLKITAGLLYLFLYAPIFVVVLYSFNAGRFGLAWQGLTTAWYRALADDTQAVAALKNTILLAVISTGISTVLGTVLGYGLSRFKWRAGRWVDAVLYVPVFIPDVVMAVALLLFYALLRKWLGIFELGLMTMILAHVTFQIPFVAIIVRARLHGLDPAMEEAAHDLGAGTWQTFRHVTLPLMLPGVLGAGMLAFTLSLDDFVVSFFTSGPGSTTLPILIYSSLKRGITPEINALSTLIVIASILGTVAVMLFQRRNEHS
jgi:spermidine/putrescine transport system permease protein